VRRFYKELAQGAGEGDVASVLGKSNVLDLHKYGLLVLPHALTHNKSLSHLTSLNLSENLLQSLNDGISNLVNLRHLNLKKCPLKRLPPALSVLEDLELTADLGEMRNIPDVWLLCDETGVMDYLKKALVEIGVGVMDMSDVGLRQIQPDLRDLANIWMLSLERNKITYLPSTIAILSNLTNLALNDNQLCCLPRQLGETASLKIMTL